MKTDPLPPKKAVRVDSIALTKLVVYACLVIIQRYSQAATYIHHWEYKIIRNAEYSSTVIIVVSLNTLLMIDTR